MTEEPAVAQLPAQSHGRPHAERRAAGKALRQASPRGDVATWKPAEQRADPVDLLIANSAGRLPELVPIRYGRMMSSQIGRASCRERVYI